MVPNLDARSDVFFMLMRAFSKSAWSSTSASASKELNFLAMLPRSRFLFVKMLLFWTEFAVCGLSPPPPRLLLGPAASQGRRGCGDSLVVAHGRL